MKCGEAATTFTRLHVALKAWMQRLTISLDDDLSDALDGLADNAGESKALLVRRALRDYLKRHKGSERPTERDLRTWTELLANREHVIFDVAHVRLLFEQCMEAPREFWDELHLIGNEHGVQYRDKGMTRITDILEVMESANWFHLSPESDRSWALVFTEPTSKPFVRTFLTGFFEPYPVEVDVIEERTKLRVRIASPAPVSGRTRTAAL